MSENWYRKKPTEIQAILWTGDNMVEVVDFVGMVSVDLPGFLIRHRMAGTDYDKPVLWVAANDAWVNVKRQGEWIAKDSKGCYPIDVDVFATSYEPSDGTGVRA